MINSAFILTFTLLTAGVDQNHLTNMNEALNFFGHQVIIEQSISLGDNQICLPPKCCPLC